LIDLDLLRLIIAVCDPCEVPRGVADMLARIDALAGDSLGVEFPPHEARFELWRGGRPFASVRGDPVKLLRADDWPEGDFTIRAFCSCVPGSDGAVHWGTICTYGRGLGVVRGPCGFTWTAYAAGVGR
jgi:hypothetical protein